MKKNTELRLMWIVYCLATVLFYVLMPFVEMIPILGLLGDQSSYNLFLLALVVAETPALVYSKFLLNCLVLSEIIVIALFLISSIALLRKKYILFGISLIVNICITIFTLALSIYRSGVVTTLPIYGVLNIIGNSIFCILYFVRITPKRTRTVADP